MTDRSFLASVVLAVGIAIGGGLVGWGVARGRTADRYVVFVILPRDQAPGINESSQLQKIVRVVSTVQYLLD